MVDIRFRKLNASVASSVIVAVLTFALGGGAAGYSLGVRHAERRAAVEINILQTEARNKADIASRQLARCTDYTKHLKQVSEDLKAHYEAELAKARAIAEEAQAIAAVERARAEDALKWAHKLESLLVEESF